MRLKANSLAGLGGLLVVTLVLGAGLAAAETYVLVDTGQDFCTDTDGLVIDCPAAGEALSGQDAQFTGLQSSYVDNGDGSVTDLNTGLMWQKSPPNTPRTWQEAMDYCENLELAGHDDWRAPNLKELFALNDFGLGWPYIDESIFDLAGAMMDKDE